jgi:integrase
MPRPNRGPKLKPPGKRPFFYIAWFEHGRERLRSTGTSDRREAEASLARFISERHRAAGPRDPGEIQIADILSFYGEEHAPTRKAPERIGYEITALLSYWSGKTVAEITKGRCREYVKKRRVAAGTARRELGTLTAALNFAADE